MTYGRAEVEERYGLTPEQFVDLKALIGDSSDNIPGVSGVGEKTAAKFLSQYGDIDTLYGHIDEVSGPKTRQNLIDAKEDVERNRRLMSIVTDLDLEYDPEQCRLGDYDREAVLRLFQELEFRSLARELPQTPDEIAAAEQAPTGDENGQFSLFGNSDSASAAPPVDSPYLCVQDDDTLARVLDALRQSEWLSFDVETTSTDAMRATLVGLGVAWAPGAAAYFPIGHHKGQQLEWEPLRGALQPIFADPQRKKLAHNAKYDITVLRRYGLEIPGPIHDTMNMAWVIDPGRHDLGLKAQAAAELGWSMTEITELIGTGRKQITMEQVAAEPAAAYCGADVDATLQLYPALGKPTAQAGAVGPLLHPRSAARAGADADGDERRLARHRFPRRHVRPTQPTAGRVGTRAIRPRGP